jgi:hypothetical protein
MLAFVALILVVGYFNAPKGKLPKATGIPAPAKPLYKPEPASLLSRVHLSAGQRATVEDIDSRWRRDKANLEIAMAQFQPKQARADQIGSSLQGYSQLSRDFDAARSRYWTAAVAVLTPAQRKEIER